MPDAPRSTGWFPYRPVPGWAGGLARLGAWEYPDVSVGPDGRIHVLARNPSFVAVLDRAGALLDTWGAGQLSQRPHAITVAPDGTVHVVDAPAHVVRVFDPDGRPLRTLGTGRASDTGLDDSLPVPAWTATVIRAAGPFNHPTKVALGAGGISYVADGYGNARVHRFDADGTLLSSWGAPGIGPGEFMLPHAVTVLRDGTVLVADREADRLQRFTPTGEHLASWTDVRRPTAVAECPDGTLVVAELAWRAGETSHRRGPVRRGTPARLSVVDARGRVLGRFGNAPGDAAAGRLSAPHGVAVDGGGDLYVAEVTSTFTGRAQFPTLHKFERVEVGSSRR